MLDGTVYSTFKRGEKTMKVLALSHSYEPIGVIPWQKAINLYFSGKVQILAEYSNSVHSPSRSMNIPSVVVFKNSKRNRIKSARFSRKNVWIRDEGRCQYCGINVSVKIYTLDHVIPKVHGGTTCWTNVVTCCYACNQKKGHKNLQQSGMKLLKPVVKPQSLPYLHDVDFFHLNTSQMPEDWKFWLGAI